MTEDEEARLLRLEKTVAVSVILGIVAAAWLSRLVMVIVDAATGPVFATLWSMFERVADMIGRVLGV